MSARTCRSGTLLPLVFTAVAWLCVGACTPSSPAVLPSLAEFPSSGPAGSTRPAGTDAPTAATPPDPCAVLVRDLAALAAADLPGAPPLVPGRDGTGVPPLSAPPPGTAPPAVPDPLAAAARRWAGALRAEAAGATAAAPSEGAPVVDPEDVAVVEEAVRAACGPGP
jgi:hypothetical protein